jgi:hypothetical protein
MLQVLSQFSAVATHTYRDMPFVMAPVLWSRFSKAFHKNNEPRERAHGDGMKVDYDSPEAFEEILWRAFWPEKYTDTRIIPLSYKDMKYEANIFFNEHIKKIISLRRPDRIQEGRYLSKNNNNIGRLDLITRMFPDAKILIPVRYPFEQAISLHRQHQNFIKMHKKDAFTSRYMADIGHYEFGDLHRPIAFPDIDKLIFNRNPSEIDYWLAYWIAAYKYVLERRNQVIIIPYEAACTDGKKWLTHICGQLEIPSEGIFDIAVSIFKAPSPPRADKVNFESKLRKIADELYIELIG